MKFWGVEVKNGETVKVQVGDDFILHLSQACLGEVKKDKANESAHLYVRIGDKKFVLGMLSAEKFPQISFDLVFEQDFELSHNWKNGSVHFTGYKATHIEDDDSFESDSEMGDVLPVAADINNGKLESQAEKVNVAKPDSKQVKIVEPSKDAKPDEDTYDSSDEEDLSEDDGPSDQGKEENNSSDSSSDDDDDESAEDDDESSDEDDSEDDDESDGAHETPNKVELGKKRSAEAATKTPVSDKKAKFITPQKTDGKKVGGHTATPHPSKHAAKTLANSDQKKEQTQKSFACKSCNRSFGSDNALQSHTKAKHSAA